MRVTVFGATGGTGQHVVRRALEQGYEVTAFARTPSDLETADTDLTIVQGDVTDYGPVDNAVHGADAVISVLGPSSNTPDYAISHGIQNIIDAMHAHNVKRLIVTTGAGVTDPRDQQGLLSRGINIILKIAARNVYRDMKRVAKIVRASDLIWTLVRAPMLTDDPGTGDIKVGYIGQGTGPRLSREDFARFIVAQVENQTYVHEAPVVSN